jgi:hypothetical protein
MVIEFLDCVNRSDYYKMGNVQKLSHPKFRIRPSPESSEPNTRLHILLISKLKLNSVAFSPQANYTDRATAACRRS